MSSPIHRRLLLKALAIATAAAAAPAASAAAAAAGDKLAFGPPVPYRDRKSVG